MKSNYEILGLPENAPIDLVEKKYGALLRQYKQRTTEYGATYENIEYYQTITKAYDEITGKQHDLSDENPNSIIPYKVRKKLGKFTAFIDNYKLLIMIIVLVIVFGVIYFLQRNVEKEDLYIKVVGAYGSSDVDKLCNQVKDKSNVLEAPLINFFTVTTDTEYSTAKENETTQFLAQYRAGYLDVILVDKESFDVYIKDFVFLKLDDYLEEHKDEEAFQNLKLYTYKQTGNGKISEPADGVYGIEISDTSYFDDMEFVWLYNADKGQEKTMILTIASSSKRKEKAEKYATELVESLLVKSEN